MSGTLERALREARNWGDGLAVRVRKGGGLTQAMAENAGAGMDNLARAQNNLTQHAEQYKHFTGYAYAIIGTIARRIAGQQIRVARVLSEQERRERERRTGKAFKGVPRAHVPATLRDHHANAEVLEDHRLLDAIRRPNRVMTRYALMYVTIASLEITGKSHWWLRRMKDGTSQIWPIPSSWIEPVHLDGRLYSHWEVRPPGVGEPVLIDGLDIAYMYYPDPSNPLSAIAPLQALAKTVVADESIEEAQRRAFLNGVNPGLALIAGRLPEVAGVEAGQRMVLTKAQRDVLLLAIKQQYRGVQNNEEPLILDGLITDAKRITNAPREMDFLNSSMATKGRLAQGWGVNPISMGEIEGANRASSQVADAHLLANVVNPRIELISEILTAWVGPLWSDDDENLLVYIEPAHAVDIDYELQVETSMIDRGAMSRNEWRQRHGLPALADGNTAFVNGVEIDVEVIDQDGGGDTSQSGGRRRPGSGHKSLAQALGHSGVIGLGARQQAGGEKSLADDLRDHLTRLGETLGARLHEQLRRGAMPTSHLVDHLFHDHGLVEGVRDACRPHLERLAATGAVTEWELHRPRRSGIVLADKGLLDDLGRIPKDITRGVSEFVSHVLSRDYWAGIVGTIRDAMADALRRATRAGHSGAELADRVVRRTFGANASATRATTIARTESTGALNGGSEVSRDRLTRLGVVRGRRWVCRMDGRERRDHHAANGQVVGLHEEFTVGGESCRYPGDPNLSARQRCNCRCLVNSVTEVRR